MKNKNLKGQAVLIVLLSLSVVLIIVLYIMSKSITDISLTSKEENSMRAFSAAEAGIERALVIGSDIGNTTIGDASFTADVSGFGTGQSSLVYPLSLKSGEIANFWFARPTEVSFSGNQVRVCWGLIGTSNSNSETPALEVSVFYRTAGGAYQISRVSLDPNSGRTVTNNFSIASTSACTIGGVNFAFQNTVSLAGLTNLQFMTVKPLYNVNTSHKIGIDVSGTGSLLPSQGIKVNSDGSFGGSNRSIEVFQLHPVVPSVFMNSIYSSTGITK